MGFVIAIAQQKGGAGKSTVAASLAVALAASGRRVALLDTDPQATLSRWWALRKAQPRATALTFEAPSGWRLTGAIERLRRDHDTLLIDTAPHAETDSRVAIRVAGLVIVPMQPAGPDLWASEATLKLAATEKRPARILLNRVPATGKLTQHILAELAGRGLATLGPGLGNRSAFTAAFMQGLAVTEAAPRGVAALEVLSTLEALLPLIKESR